MATVLKNFLWSSNGHEVEKLVAGAVREFGAATAGLVAEGYISADSVVVVPEAPVVIEPIIEPVVEPVIEMVAEFVEPIVAEVVTTEPVVEVVAEPVAAEVVTEPVIEPVVEPVAPVAEQPKRRKPR